MLPDLGIFERIFAEKDVHGLTLFHGSLRITHFFFTSTYPLVYLTGSNRICGVLMNEVEWHLLNSNLLLDQKLDPQVDTHIYELIRLAHR